MAWNRILDKESVIELAKREASPEHYRDFEPITRGPLFAILMLIPLGLLAAAFVVAGATKAGLTRVRQWRQAPPST